MEQMKIMKEKKSDKQKSVREVRISKRISLNEAALKIGINAGRLGYLENNPRKIPVRLALSLTRLYGVTIDQVTFMR